MAPPSFPFHGIFSSLGQDDLPSAKSTIDESPIPHPSEQAERAQNAALGKIAVDIYEQDNYYIIKAPIAGVSLSDLDIEISDNVLTIRGTRQQTDDVPENQYYMRECFWGAFSRSVTMPCTIDAKRVKATFNKESILKILIPKEDKVKIVRINES